MTWNTISMQFQMCWKCRKPREVLVVRDEFGEIREAIQKWCACPKELLFGGASDAKVNTDSA
jgi:hypothetical protein